MLTTTVAVPLEPVAVTVFAPDPEARAAARILGQARRGNVILSVEHTLADLHAEAGNGTGIVLWTGLGNAVAHAIHEVLLATQACNVGLR